MLAKLVSLFGIFGFVGIAVLFSNNRKKIDWKLVGAGIGLQFFFALIILKTKVGKDFFEWANSVIMKLLSYTNEGTKFIFGTKVLDMSAEGYGDFVFAVQVLPTILFFSSLMSILYHIGVMQLIVKVIAKVMVRLLGTSGAETLSASANIFVGQTEAPLLIKPFVSKMTMSELMVVMTGGFATVAGGVLALYVTILAPYFPDIAGHLMAASIMSAPAALVMAKILIPETEVPETRGKVEVPDEKPDSNVIEAAANGAAAGMHLAFNVGAMLLVFIALIALANGMLGFLGGLFGFPNFSFSLIMSYVFAPLAFLMGVPSNEVLAVGDLLGQKLVINEVVAYTALAKGLENGTSTLSPRTVVILTYALCGFANLSSIGIQIGGIGSIAPERKGDLAKLGLVAVLGGTLACFQTATIAGVLINDSEINMSVPGAVATPAPPQTSPTPSPETEPSSSPSPSACVPSAELYSSMCSLNNIAWMSHIRKIDTPRSCQGTQLLVS